ncbi:MAG: hypothetical protein AAB728_05080 [Patescibacteria group bacterium]
MAESIAATVETALSRLEPARIGAGFEPDFDPDDEMFEDRRDGNDDDDLLTNGAPFTLSDTGELLPDHERFLSSWGAVRAEAKDAKEILPAFLGSLKYEEKNLVPWYGRKW